MHRLTIDNPDDGTFRLAFTNPNDLKKKSSDEMKANMSGDEVRDRIKTYFNSVGLNTVVTKKNFNAEGTEAEGEDVVTQSVYEIRLDRLVSTESTAAIQVAKGSTKATITVEKAVEISGPPMTGQWQIKCVYSDNTYELTNPLNLDASDHTI